MNIPYASPNLRLIDVARALFFSREKANSRIKNYFSGVTGKKYILITNTCRSALYLTYNALDTRGEVITSPLTCKVAVDPIIESGNEPVYGDINPGDLNIRPEDIGQRMNKNTVAVQAIHLGGVPCDMDRIMAIARKRKLPVIEDCAQSLGAVYKCKPVGSFGAVACFSLIKNAYGIGGGILATDDASVYQKAQAINDRLRKTSLPLVLFRIVRNLLDTGRRNRLVFLLYRFVMTVKGGRQHYQSVKGQLRQVSPIEVKIAATQISRLKKLHQKRKEVGIKYCDLLTRQGMMRNHDFEVDNASFTKLFVYHPIINSKKYLKALREQGIEAMHLEHKNGSPFQERLVPADSDAGKALQNYNKVHESLICLPVVESLGDREVESIIEILKKIFDDRK